MYYLCIMVKEIIYIECPDKNCRVWFDNSDNIEKLCKKHCKGEPKCYIICHNCGKKLYFEIDMFRIMRIDCECGACNFQRMSNNYERV